MKTYIVAQAVGGVPEQPDITYRNYQLIDADTPKVAENTYNAINHCNYYYGQTLAELPIDDVSHLCGIERFEPTAGMIADIERTRFLRELEPLRRANAMYRADCEFMAQMLREAIKGFRFLAEHSDYDCPPTADSTDCPWGDCKNCRNAWKHESEIQSFFADRLHLKED